MPTDDSRAEHGLVTTSNVLVLATWVYGAVNERPDLALDNLLLHPCHEYGPPPAQVSLSHTRSNMHGTWSRQHANHAGRSAWSVAANIATGVTVRGPCGPPAAPEQSRND